MLNEFVDLMQLTNLRLKNGHISHNFCVEVRMEKQSEHLPSIKSLRVLEQVAHFGNVARAAAELSITPSAASH